MPFLVVLRGTVKAVIHATLAGRMLILCRIIELTRPAEKQQRYNQMKTVSHLFRLFDSKVLYMWYAKEKEEKKTTDWPKLAT